MSTHATPPSAHRPPVALVVLLLHGALATALLLQADTLPRLLTVAAPIHVTLVKAPESPRPEAATALSTPMPGRAPALPLLAAPAVEVRPVVTPAAPEQAPAPAPAVEAMPAPIPKTAFDTPRLSAPSPTPTPAPAPAAAEPRPVSSSAIRYRVPPPVAVPLASRRLGESGTVWLRVRVDRQGLPAQVSVHQSSGYPRLDEQALAAMQAARFVPQSDNGTPIEWVVIAPLAYDLD